MFAPITVQEMVYSKGIQKKHANGRFSVGKPSIKNTHLKEFKGFFPP